MVRSLAEKRTYLGSLFVILFFVYWKSHFSDGLLAFLNTNIPLTFVRTIDYTDLVSLFVIPLAHHVYNYRRKYEVKKKIFYKLKIPMICLLGLSVMATSVMLPRHKYVIKKKVKNEKISVKEAITIIKQVTEPFEMYCIKCNVDDKEGEFSKENKEYPHAKPIVLKYYLLENNEGVKFDIKGERGNVFVKGNHSKLEQIRRNLKVRFENKFKNMEFVIDLSEEGSLGSY